MVYVIAHDGGVEGYSGPLHVFKTKDEAIAAASLGDSLVVFEVPEWPEKAGPWWDVKPISAQ